MRNLFQNLPIRWLSGLLGLIMIFAGFHLFIKTFPCSPISIVVDFTYLRICSSITWVGDSFKGLYKQIKFSREAREEISNLKLEISKLRDMTINYHEIKRENARLIKYYDIKKENPKMKFTSAPVISRSGSSIILGSGIFEGISDNDPVITENGFVGRISKANAFTSDVKTVLSSDLSISATDCTTGGIGIISGNKSLIKENLTRLTFIESQDSIKDGNILVTSGLSGMCPKGLKVGKVKSIERDNFSYYAIIEPFEKINEIESVFIITNFLGKGKTNLKN
ncbi:MAG: rod shape-determining protein MreC [Oscillospiraceae bacterium]|jgi:rod shape-determining protein MreC|nr:rod shape-determining protein MreC [Oscillospiraceae bacterium]